MSFLWYLFGSGAAPGWIVGFTAEVFESECLRWLIQSPSGTGRRTGLEGTWFRPFCPVDEVRGGIMLGERKDSLTIVEGPGWDRFR